MVVYSGAKLTMNRIKAIVYKKNLIFRRTWILNLIQIIIPIFFLSVSIMVSRMFESNRELPGINVELSAGYQDSVTYLGHAKNVTEIDVNITESYKKYFIESNIPSMALVDIEDKNISEYYLEKVSVHRF